MYLGVIDKPAGGENYVLKIKATVVGTCYCW